MYSKLMQQFSSKDPRLRPDIDKATVVQAQIQVIGLGPIQDLNEEFEISIFLRLGWTDKRLAWNGSVFDQELKLPHGETLPLDSDIMNEIWVPDIFFRNAKTEYMHNNTRPNVMCRIDSNGRVSISRRISLVSRCEMDFANFPFDVHNCQLVFSSFQYNRHELWLQWKPENPVYIPTNSGQGYGLRLTDFYLEDESVSSAVIRTNSGEYTTLVICFKFVRHMIYYAINSFFIPCLLVCLSHVSFWIEKSATSARTSYGALTVLALTIFSVSERLYCPKVSYTTAYDIYVSVCFVYVFAAFIEFAVVNYFTIIRPNRLLDRAMRHWEEVCKKYEKKMNLEAKMYYKNAKTHEMGSLISESDLARKHRISNRSRISDAFSVVRTPSTRVKSLFQIVSNEDVCCSSDPDCNFDNNFDDYKSCSNNPSSHLLSGRHTQTQTDDRSSGRNNRPTSSAGPVRFLRFGRFLAGFRFLPNNPKIEFKI